MSLDMLRVVDVGLGQFAIGQVVQLLNFKSPRQIVASGTVSGVWGVDKFHFKPIPHSFYKVDVTQVQVGDAPLMHPHPEGDQLVVADVIGGSVLWSQKHLKV
jgi:hypothetical protein